MNKDNQQQSDAPEGSLISVFRKTPFFTLLKSVLPSGARRVIRKAILGDVAQDIPGVTSSSVHEQDKKINPQKKLVSKETLKEAYTPYQLNKYGDSTEDYRFGVDLHYRHGNHHIDSEGSWLGFSNYFSRNLKNKSSIIILTNTDQKPAFIADFIEDIISDLRE